MTGIVLIEWKSYFIGKCAHVFKDAQAGLPLGVLIFKRDTRLFPRARIYNKVCGCLERNGIYWLDIKHPNLQTYARLGWHTAHVCPCIYGLFCTNYRVVIAGVVATFYPPNFVQGYCKHRINNLIQYALGNNKHLLCQLPRSGWSVGRAGLGAKATYPA